MCSLIKFYIKLPDTKLNEKTVPIVVYPLTQMGNTSLSCMYPCKGNQNNSPSEMGSLRFCCLRKGVMWEDKTYTMACPLSVGFSGDKIVNHHDKWGIASINQMKRDESLGCLFFSSLPPPPALLSGKPHNQTHRFRATVTCAIWVFFPAKAYNKRMKCSFSALLKSCSAACYELDSQSEYLPL